jgi:transposase
VTPVLGDRQRHRPKVSMVGVLCYRPDGSAARLLVGFHRGSYDTATLVKVLTGLHAFLGGAPVNLVWDNLKAHKSTAMGEFLADQDWLQVDYLPAYAPELNPVEGLWANLKGGELANRCCQTAEEVIATAQDGHDLGPPGWPAAAVVVAADRPDPMNPRSARARSGR